MSKEEQYLVREATGADIPVMVDFLVKLGLHVSGAPRQTLTQEAQSRLENFLHDYLEDTEKLLVVTCTGDGDVIGMGNIQIWRSPNLWEEAEHLDLTSGFIDDLWVEPAYRQKGILRRMLDVLVAFAESHGIAELVLEYSTSNREAAAFLSGRPAPVETSWDRASQIAAHYERAISHYGKELGVRCTRKHVSAYIDNAPVPEAERAKRRAMLLRETNPSRVSAGLAALFADAASELAA